VTFSNVEVAIDVELHEVPVGSLPVSVGSLAREDDVASLF
jgi:hypothetical protein